MTHEEIFQGKTKIVVQYKMNDNVVFDVRVIISSDWTDVTDTEKKNGTFAGWVKKLEKRLSAKFEGLEFRTA